MCLTLLSSSACHATVQLSKASRKMLLLLQDLMTTVADEISHRLRLTAGHKLPSDNASSTMFTRQHLVRYTHNEIWKCY